MYIQVVEEAAAAAAAAVIRVPAILLPAVTGLFPAVRPVQTRFPEQRGAAF
jgi:hypothetical protein